MDRSLTSHHVTLSWEGSRVPLRIPLHLTPDDIGCGQQYPSVKQLISRFRDKCTLLYNAVLLEKRVLFLGHNIASNDVSMCVLSAVDLVCPPLEGLLRARAFPYTNLFDLTFKDVPAYIAGTTNPMFRSHTEWWDVLLDLQTGIVDV